MKNFFSLTFLFTLILSCGKKEQQVVREEPASVEEAIPLPPAPVTLFDNTATIDSFYRAIETETDNNPEVAEANEFIFNPFGVDEQELAPIPEYGRKINASVVVDKEATANRHYPETIDTIFTLQFDSSSIRFYYPALSERYMLFEATIKSPNISLKNNIRVGMSRSELLDQVKDYKLFIKEEGDSIMIWSGVTDTSLTFKLKNGKVQRIQYDPYLD